MTRRTEAPEMIRFECPLPPRALRRNSETRNSGWRAALVREYQEQVWCAGATGHSGGGPVCPRCQGPPWERAVLLLTWRHAGVAPDEDNALASLKACVDVLGTKGARPLGLIVDDSPAHLSIRCVTEKVRTRAEEGVVVELTKA